MQITSRHTVDTFLFSMWKAWVRCVGRTESKWCVGVWKSYVTHDVWAAESLWSLFGRRQIWLDCRHTYTHRKHSSAQSPSGDIGWTVTLPWACVCAGNPLSNLGLLINISSQPGSWKIFFDGHNRWWSSSGLRGASNQDLCHCWLISKSV